MEHSGPPEALLEKCTSPIYPRVASELWGASPLENLRPDGGGNKGAGLWADTRVTVLLLGPQDKPLNSENITKKIDRGNTKLAFLCFHFSVFCAVWIVSPKKGQADPGLHACSANLLHAKGILALKRSLAPEVEVPTFAVKVFINRKCTRTTNLKSLVTQRESLTKR